MDDLKIPNHVGIIVDGNGRWAVNKGKSRSMGHKAGASQIDKIIDYAFDKGVNYLSLFVFSTENFKRSEDEVNYLMKLIKIKFEKDFKKLKKDKVRVLVSGRREPLSEEVLKVIDEAVEDTKEFTGKVLNICLNYGGISEIVDASKKICNEVMEGKISLDDITENNWHRYLYNDLPQIDLLIRTSGEQRISNFMLFNLAYAELYFPKTLFPDFDEDEFDKALLVYNKRDRRFGGYNNENKNS